MKFSKISLLIQSLLFVGLPTISHAIKIEDLVGNSKGIYIPEVNASFYDDATGYPNEKSAKYQNKNNLDSNSDEPKFDVERMAKEYVAQKHPDIDFVKVRIINKEFSLANTVIFNHVINGIPVINSHISVTLNGETGKITNEEITIIENIKKVEKNDVINAGKKDQVKKLINDINIMLKQLEITNDPVKYEDVVVDEDYDENYIFLTDVPFTSDGKLRAQLVYNCDEEDGAVVAKLEWNLKFYYRTNYYTVRFRINDGEVSSANMHKDNYNFIPYYDPGDDKGGKGWITLNSTNPEIKNASPYGWNKVGSVTYNVPFGNNAQVYYDFDDRSTFQTFNQDPDFNFNFSYNKKYKNDHPLNRDFALTNIFYMMNVLHDIFYNIGFDEASGNFQNINYSGEGLGGDPVIVINFNNNRNSKKKSNIVDISIPVVSWLFLLLSMDNIQYYIWIILTTPPVT